MNAPKSWAAAALGAQDVERGSDAARMEHLEARIADLRARRLPLVARHHAAEAAARDVGSANAELALVAAELKEANLELSALQTKNYQVQFRDAAKEMLSPDLFAAIHGEVIKRQVQFERGRRQGLVGSAVDVRGAAPGPKQRADE